MICLTLQSLQHLCNDISNCDYAIMRQYSRGDKGRVKTMPGSQAIHQNPVRWGILSAANIGVKAVAPAIVASSNGQLMAVGSRDEKRAAELYSFAPPVRIYKNYEQIFQDPEIEAVYNPLPNSLHAEWSIKALQAGKHVLCEKPLAVTAKEAATMVETARAHN